MPTLENDLIRIELDEHWPRLVRSQRLDSGATLEGCSPAMPFLLELNGETYEPRNEGVTATAERVDYLVVVPELGLHLHFRFALDGQTVVFTLPEVREEGEFKLQQLYMPYHRLVTGTAAAGDSYYRGFGVRGNWSREWCPGVGAGGGEDFGPVADGIPERGIKESGTAVIWNEGVCAVATSSTHINPWVTLLDTKGQLLKDRAGQFSFWPGVYSYRLYNQLAAPFEIRLALLGDYNGNGVIDWCDAAAWQGDQGYADKVDPYHEVIVGKIYLDDNRQPAPFHTFADVLRLVEQVHEVSGGLKHIVYLVGWQGEGHDTAYPAFGPVNERIGGREALLDLIEKARALNCVISLHINLDDSYEGHPEYREDLLSRDANGKKHLWYHNFENGGRNVYSISHTLSVASGYEEDRLNRLLELLPIRDSIHCDAHRPFNEVWLEDGTHISAECEVQLGMVAIKKMYLERGIDITTEGISADSHGLYFFGRGMGWGSRYGTVIAHGRVRCETRHNAEGFALGASYIGDERYFGDWKTTAENFYLHWMYQQVIHRKKMLNYKIGAWNEGIEAWLEDDGYIRSARGGHAPIPLYVRYEGIDIACGDDRFLPWRDDIIFAYSKNGGPQEWTLPASWEGREIEAQTMRPGGPALGPVLTIEGRTIKFVPPAGYGVKLMRK